MGKVTWEDILQDDPEAGLPIERVAYTSYKALGRDRERIDALGSRLKGTVWNDTKRRDEVLEILRQARAHLREAEKLSEQVYLATYRQRQKQRKDKK